MYDSVSQIYGKNWSHAITVHQCDNTPCCDSGFYWQSSLVLVVVALLHLQHDSFLQYHLPVHIDMSSHHPQCECPSSESKNIIKYWIIKIKQQIYKSLIWKLSLWIRKRKQSTMKISDVWGSKHQIWRGSKIEHQIHYLTWTFTMHVHVMGLAYLIISD